ncbi:hypothetical protein ACFQJ7_17150 [Halovenus rubra]|uniref:Restriction endonuclease n=2 Tax=Halovenus rubra TaxID=869890 RepID=A0ABD5X958_9EURY|nr:hypothetical protein [Halovenus rubra]
MQKIDSLDETKQKRAMELVDRASGEGGAQFLADAATDTTDTTIDDVLGMTLDTSDTPYPDDLADQVRVGLVKEHSREHLKPDNWAGKIYPDADSSTEVAGKIAKELDELEDTEGVEGIMRLPAKTNGAGSGAYLIDLPAPGASQSAVKGASLEIRVGSATAEGLLDGETLRLSYKPDVEFTDITDEEIDGDPLEEIAERVYNDPDKKGRVKKHLGIDGDSDGKQPEFDVIRESSDSDRKTAYWEAKNSKTLPPSEIRDQASRYLAYRILNGDTDLSNTAMVVVTRTETQAKNLNKAFDSSWFKAKPASDIDSDPMARFSYRSCAPHVLAHALMA